MKNNELEHIAPKLAELKKRGTGFVVPKGYFELLNFKLEEQIFNKNSIPDGYFDTLEDQVFDRLNSETKVVNFKSIFVKRVIPYTVAASLLLFVSLQFFNKKATDSFANIEISEIEEWIDYGEIELNSYEIASVYEDEDFENLEINQFSDSDLIDYLDDIDIESLMLTN